MEDFVLILTHHDQTIRLRIRLEARQFRECRDQGFQILVRAKSPHINNRAMPASTVERYRARRGDGCGFSITRNIGSFAFADNENPFRGDDPK